MTYAKACAMHPAVLAPLVCSRCRELLVAQLQQPGAVVTVTLEAAEVLVGTVLHRDGLPILDLEAKAAEHLAGDLFDRIAAGVGIARDELIADPQATTLDAQAGELKTWVRDYLAADAEYRKFHHAYRRMDSPVEKADDLLSLAYQRRQEARGRLMAALAAETPETGANIHRVREVVAAFSEGYAAGYERGESGEVEDKENAWDRSKASAGLLAAETPEGRETKPDGLVQEWVCRGSTGRPGSACPGRQGIGPSSSRSRGGRGVPKK